jgi:5-methylcytosine-specific restriction endonuclease McrA
MHEAPNNRDPERDAVLFNGVVRLLGACGYSNVNFDIGGKKSRRRYVMAESPEGEQQTIWIKATTSWPRMAEVVRFPWKMISHDGVSAVKAACDTASQRGATHFLAASGDDLLATLSFARLYLLSDIPTLVARQSELADSVFYKAHNSSLIIASHSYEFNAAADVAVAYGIALLNPLIHPPTSSIAPVARKTMHTDKSYTRDPKVRAIVLKRANGHCECCGEAGFVTLSGSAYLETHHIVGLAERGPDSKGNIVALCPLCHRKAHFAADKIAIERALLKALRCRGSSNDEV